MFLTCNHFAVIYKNKAESLFTSLPPFIIIEDLRIYRVFFTHSHMLPECLFFFLLFIPLRSFGGGLHLKTYFACFIGSCLILLFTLLSVKYFTIPLFISFVLYAFCAILILIIGPVNHPNRKVNSHDNTIFAKRTYLTIVFTFVIAILFIVTNNAKYMFLQAIVFLFIYATSFIGHILYK